MKRYRSWIPAVVFWTWFLVSIGAARRYRWVDTVWNVAWILLLAVISICSVVDIFRKRHERGGYMGYRGVPRWVVRFFGGDSS